MNSLLEAVPVFALVIMIGLVPLLSEGPPGPGPS
jgi:hypothetical protein